MKFAVVGLADLAGLRAEAALRGDLEAVRQQEFIAKVRYVVGLYLSPLEYALVLAVDEKSQIQTLDRTARACRSCRDPWPG